MFNLTPPYRRRGFLQVLDNGSLVTAGKKVRMNGISFKIDCRIGGIGYGKKIQNYLCGSPVDI
jgi:hypothetical protein